MELSELEKRTLLLEDPHILRIEDSEEWDFPDIDLKLWSEERRNYSSQRLKYIKSAFSNPYIVDDFGSDHSSRREWRREFKREHEWARKYLEQDSLRVNNREVILICIDSLLREYQGTNAEEFKTRFDNIYKLQKGNRHYNSLPSEKKIEEMRAIKQAAFDLLVYLSEQEPI